MKGRKVIKMLKFLVGLGLVVLVLSMTFMLFSMSLSGCGGEIKVAECRYNSNCGPNKICDEGKCKQLFPPPLGPLVEGSVILPCKCWQDVFMYTGQVRKNPWCVSGSDIASLCYNCCEFYHKVCIEREMMRLCL